MTLQVPSVWLEEALGTLTAQFPPLLAFSIRSVIRDNKRRLLCNQGPQLHPGLLQAGSSRKGRPGSGSSRLFS